jgi:hypothetical protein
VREGDGFNPSEEELDRYLNQAEEKRERGVEEGLERLKLK